MKIKDIVRILNAEILFADEKMLETEVNSACASDMMSDVLAFVKDQAVLITGLCNPQVVRTAVMMDMVCIVLVRGKQPDEIMLKLASEKRMSWGKAVFYSFFGCLRNIIPVILLVLLVGAMIVAFGLLASALIAAFGSTDAAVTFVVMPLAFMMLTLVYSVYWPMYASLFEDVR